MWAARSLQCYSGLISIPAIFGLGWPQLCNRLVGQIAATIAVPYGIYQAQRSVVRFSDFVIIASLSLTVSQQRGLSTIKLLYMGGIVWVVINSLGIAVSITSLRSTTLRRSLSSAKILDLDF